MTVAERFDPEIRTIGDAFVDRYGASEAVRELAGRLPERESDTDRVAETLAYIKRAHEVPT